MLSCSFFSAGISIAQVYKVTSSKVKFKSDAPLEVIVAESAELNGLLDVKTKLFAFTVNNESFKGFNSQLQQTHFNDNYLETDKYPVISFSGKIIDDIDFNSAGNYVVRTKGMLNIKGVNREQLIKSTVEIKDGKIKILSSFSILLDDYNIRIPRIVSQKIAPEIFIDINTIMENRK
jgi:polyisoprenoid-binding protein YceI